MKIELLRDNQNFIPEIAELRFREFGYLVPDKTLKDFQAGLETHLNERELPIALVLKEEEKFVGMSAIRTHDMDTHKHLSPWLAGMLVHPDKRNKGFGSFLVKQTETWAKLLGYSRLYLFTPNKAAWYTKFGWEVYENAVYNSVPVTIMTKPTIENTYTHRE